MLSACRTTNQKVSKQKVMPSMNLDYLVSLVKARTCNRLTNSSHKTPLLLCDFGLSVLNLSRVRWFDMESSQSGQDRTYI